VCTLGVWSAGDERQAFVGRRHDPASVLHSHVEGLALLLQKVPLGDSVAVGRIACIYYDLIVCLQGIQVAKNSAVDALVSV
jgi:hypothetical protein